MCNTIPMIRKNAFFPSWCLDFSCPKCSKKWNVCKYCSPRGKQKTRLTTTEQRTRHDSLHEDETLPINDAVETERNDEDSSEMSRKRSSQSVSTEELKQTMGNKEAAEYYCNNLFGKGNMCLVNRQLYNGNKLVETPVDDVNLHLLMAMLLLRISTGDTKLFGRTLHVTVKKTMEIDSTSRDCKTTHEALHTPAPIGTPSSSNDLRKYLESVYGIV